MNTTRTLYITTQPPLRFKECDVVDTILLIVAGVSVVVKQVKNQEVGLTN